MKTIHDLSLYRWQLKGTAPYVPLRGNSMETGVALEGVTNWMDADVPGGVALALYRAGYIEHPYYGMNSLKCEWIENKWWIYETSFELSQMNGERMRLVFDGVDYECTVYWNNKVLGEHKGMYEPFSFDVTDLCKQGEQVTIRVLLKHAPDEMGQIGKTSETFTQKSRFNYKWDFSTRLVNLGIWQGVRLECTDIIELSDIYMSSDVLESGEGLITASVSVTGNTEGESLRLGIDCKLNGKTARQVVFENVTDDICTLNVVIQNPALWYPNGMGEQPLYDISITLYGGDEPIDCYEQQLGIRKLAFEHNDNSPPNAQPYLMLVNGERMYMKGVNITPLDHIYGDVPQEQIEYTLRRAVEMNCNLVRIWGGGIIETEVFYEYCDKNGLLIWQEFIQSSSGIDNIPSKKAEFLTLLERSARAAVKQKRNHTCLVIWSGGNELMDENRVPCTIEDENIALLNRIVTELDPKTKFLPTSASGPNEFIQNEPGQSHDVHGWWQYQGNPHHYSFYAGSDSLLHSEFGCDGMSSLESIHKILPKDELKPVPMTENAMWRFHGDWWCTYKRDHEIFGDSLSLEEYISCSQWMQAEGLRFILEANRRRKFRNSGSIIWQLNEPWPNISCTNLLEYHGAPKMAYYWAKLAFSAFHPTFTYEKLNYAQGETMSGTINLLTDSCVVAGIAEVVAEVVDLYGDRLYKESFQAEIASNCSNNVGEFHFTIPTHFNGMYCLRITASSDKYCRENTYYFTTESVHPYQSALKTSDAQLDGNLTYRQGEIEAVIENVGTEAALHIHFKDMSDTFLLYPDMDYFTLFPGEKRTVLIQYQRKFVFGFDENTQLSSIEHPDLKADCFSGQACEF